MPKPADLAAYRKKRDFGKTSEPKGGTTPPAATGNRFVVHKHHASSDHYDLRLEHNGVLKSWAVPKGPSLDPADKRYAAETEDHPLEYFDFEGVIPAGEYGGGPMIVWDWGVWAPMEDFETGLAKGAVKFRLAGEKLIGRLDAGKAQAEEEGRAAGLDLLQGARPVGRYRERYPRGASGEREIGEADRGAGRGETGGQGSR